MKHISNATSEHRKKIKLARSMVAKDEFIRGKSIFDTRAWNKRKADIANRVAKKQSHGRTGK